MSFRSLVWDYWEKVVAVCRKRVGQMERSKLVGLVRTVLGVRNWLLEKEGQEGVEAMQEMARAILKQMGRSTIEWGDMKGWEVTVVRMLIREVEGVPGFVARLVDQLLSRMDEVGQAGVVDE